MKHLSPVSYGLDPEILDTQFSLEEPGTQLGDEKEHYCIKCIGRRVLEDE